MKKKILGKIAKNRNEKSLVLCVLQVLIVLREWYTENAAQCARYLVVTLVMMAVLKDVYRAASAQSDR